MIISGQMITLIKLLVILFISLLGYDTINLIIQHNNTNEELELGKYALENEVHLENITWDFWALCLIVSGGVIFLYRKWQRNVQLNIVQEAALRNLQFIPERKEINIDRELSNLSNKSKNERINDRSKKRNLDNVKKESLICKSGNELSENKSIKVDNEIKSNEDENITTSSKVSVLDKSLGITDMLIERMLSEPSTTIIDELVKVEAIPEEGDEDNDDIEMQNMINQNRNVIPSRPHSPIVEATNQQQIAIENDPRGRLIINYAQLEPKSSYQSEGTPFSFILPESRASNVAKPCECDVSQLEERLELVENGLKSTERITVLWRNRIEQTEEELLELQQQIHCILLDWSIKKCSVNYLNSSGDNNVEANITTQNNSILSTTSSTYTGSYKPLQIINEIIEESRKEEEQNDADTNVNDIEDKTKISSPSPSANISATQTIKLVDTAVEAKETSTQSQPSVQVDNVKDRAISDDTMYTADGRSFIDQYTEMSIQTLSDTDLIRRKSETMMNVNNMSCVQTEDDMSRYEAALELSFSISESYAEPNDQYHEKIQLLQRNEELKNETETLVKEIETVLNDDNLKSAKKFNNIQAKVPSHVVLPRTQSTRRQQQPSRRPPPRCAYSVLVNK